MALQMCFAVPVWGACVVDGRGVGACIQGVEFMCVGDDAAIVNCSQRDFTVLSSRQVRSSQVRSG